ncbi:DUF6531 domain-containing protein [Pseudomonas sp. SG20056]|uniref:DUF6531 domain-containing protein n=1 Tax=Pseudomonas sp. SG20056 TaxID=3074146 RepID=UPI00287F8814|nr:DUF6531 domain-containing protein [Pseudomonas sp. SG20056]WNF48421.1 DUF6531 domain-containing protein [Pseudomonas sp. SG20056]
MRALSAISAVLLLVFSDVSFASTYTWSIVSGRPFSSPGAVCEWLKVNTGTSTRAHEVVRYTDKMFSCRYEYYASGAGQWALTSQTVNRIGKRCEEGKVFNAVNGECVEGERGAPALNSCVGNPINAANGNKFQVETDFDSRGATPLSFTRTYNSLDGVWRHKYSARLEKIGFDIKLTKGDGKESYFNSGSKPAAKFSPLELGDLVEISGGWRYTDVDNQVFTFDTAGRLTQWRKSSGAKEQLVYAGNVVTVTNDLGGSIAFTQDSLYQPLTLDSGDLHIDYSYNVNMRLAQLTRVQGGQTEQRTFHYEDPRNNGWLTGITDERGVRYATWAYDDKGRAISSEHAGGVDKVMVSYNADGSSTVTNELGKNTVYRFTTISGTKRVVAVDGEASANCPNSNSTFTYDTRGLLKTKTDNKGHLTTYDYNARGLEVSRTEAAGTAQARTTTTEWHPTLFLPVTVTEPSRITTYTYDAQGRQLSQSVTQH